MPNGAYMTTDPLNEEDAGQLAGAAGLTLHLQFPKDPAPDGQFDVLIYDLDHWDPERRAETVAALTREPLLHPVAVHSYQLREQQITALRDNGVLVCRRLEPDVVVQLAQAAGLLTADGRVDGQPDKTAPVTEGPGRPFRAGVKEPR